MGLAASASRERAMSQTPDALESYLSGRWVRGEGVETRLVDPVSGDELATASAKGLIKKTALQLYSRPRAGGIIAVGLDEGDHLVGVSLCRAGQSIVLGTRDGMSIRFDESDVRAMGRSAVGVWGSQ